MAYFQAGTFSFRECVHSVVRRFNFCENPRLKWEQWCQRWIKVCTKSLAWRGTRRTITIQNLGRWKLEKSWEVGLGKFWSFVVCHIFIHIWKTKNCSTLCEKFRIRFDMYSNCVGFGCWAMLSLGLGQKDSTMLLAFWWVAGFGQLELLWNLSDKGAMGAV